MKRHTTETAALSNAEIASMLRELAIRYDMEDVAFKPRAFEKAAYTVEALDKPLSQLLEEKGSGALKGLPGIGEGIRRRIEEAMETGGIKELSGLRDKYPLDVQAFSSVEGLGPKSLRILFDELGVSSPEDLREAARKGRVRGIPGFGARKEAMILKSLEARSRDAGRLPFGIALRIAENLLAGLRGTGFRGSLDAAGSLRRRRETIGDIDILAAGEGAAELTERFATLPGVVRVYARGETKTLVRLREGLDADLRIVPAASFGAAMLYFTGSREHNLALRRIAIGMGLKLNEYGVFRGEERIAGKTEESVYKALGLAYIPPELRERSGEIEAAQDGRLPHLIEAGDLKGDLQVQTDWTDGAAPIEAMADAARKLGREYIAITDHTRDLAMAHGSDEKKLMEQAGAIHALNRKLRGLRVLTGAEVNIRKDGTLDIADEALSELDVVGVGIHSHFRLSRAETTARLIRAMENPHADILFHPSARTLGRRDPVEFDADEVFAAAKRTGTVLEIDSQPDRLDLKDEYIRRAVAMGVKLVISSDAHSPAELRYPEEYGIGLARRGWAGKKDVLNTLPLEKFLGKLKGGAKS
jgi:DNA polymerase (family 10)